MPAPTPPAGWSPRSAVELAEQQLAAVQAWHRARRVAEEAAQVRRQSREARMDLNRRTEVLRRQHRAIVRRSDEQLRSSVELLREVAPRRAVVGHRNAWFAAKVRDGLHERGIEVVACLDDGPDVVGVSVAEQPDLVLVEDALPLLAGADVVREVLALSPRTLVAAQCGDDDCLADLLAAGACATYPRRVPPLDVVRDLARMVGVTEPA